MDYLGLLIHAAVLLRRYENTIIREQVDPLFATLQQQLALAARPNLLGADRARISRVIEQVFAKLQERAGESLVMVAENHARKVGQAIEHRKPDPIKTAVKRDPILQPSAASSASRAQQILEQDSFDGATWKRWNEIHRDKALRDTQIQIALSRQAKESPAELRARLLKYVTRPAQIRARALTRTFALNLSNATAWETAEADPRVKGYRLLVTLDSRTSLICINYAAEHKFYLFEAGNPRPPFHFGCRTIIYPVVVGREKEKPREAEEWLDKKSAAQQDEILGEERADMWRRGELSLSELIREDNTVLTLAELRGVSASSQIR